MNNNEKGFSVIILTYNGILFIDALLNSISSQSVKPEIIIIDSGSTDGTREYLLGKEIEFQSIDKSEFNHGSTRNLGLTLANNDVVVFLTQDVQLDNSDSLELLIQPLIREEIAMSFGRQLPRPNASILSEFARRRNYPEKSIIKSIENKYQLGLKTCFISNSFAAYKRRSLQKLGNFPSHLIMCEDVFVGAKAILDGYKIAYVAEARAFHSHNYTIVEEFKRYYDIGYFYGSEFWIISNFKAAEAEGLNFAKDEFSFLVTKNEYKLLPEFFIRTLSKYLGYKLGNYPKLIPAVLKPYLSMHSYYWKNRG
jgi:rhamnosyltransferase